MRVYEFYVFVLCLVVFVLIVGTSCFLLAEIYRLTVKAIRHGIEDERITKEYLKAQKRKNKNKRLDYFVSLFLCLILCAAFAFGLYVNLTEDSFSESIPTLRVVRSASMSKKHEKNVYLVSNNLNDQFNAFDLLLTYKVPAEEELKLYDVVVYDNDGTYIVHRIVSIDEPTASKHPGERWFLCQGDANDVSDRFPIKYEQIKAIYKGENIPFVGSFVLFMQSPAGWLCVLLIIVAMIGTPILESKFNKEIIKRLTAIGVIAPVPELICKKREYRSFEERLEDSNDEIKERYATIRDYLDSLGMFSSYLGKASHSYRYKNKTAAKLAFKGKTLNLFLSLIPSKFEDSKYIFLDVSDIKDHENTPMRIKISSNRQVRWACELIDAMKEEIIA